MTRIHEWRCIWEASSAGDEIVVPVNIGWSKEPRPYFETGHVGHQAIMAPGVATELLQHYVGHTFWLADQFLKFRETTPVLRKYPCIFAPIKPLNPEQPWISWKNPASMEMVISALDQISMMEPTNPGRRIFVPLLGAGSLDTHDVECLIHATLTAPHFVLVKGRTINRHLEMDAKGEWRVVATPWTDYQRSDG